MQLFSYKQIISQVFSYIFKNPTINIRLATVSSENSVLNAENPALKSANSTLNNMEHLGAFSRNS